MTAPSAGQPLPSSAVTGLVDLSGPMSGSRRARPQALSAGPDGLRGAARSRTLAGRTADGPSCGNGTSGRSDGVLRARGGLRPGRSLRGARTVSLAGPLVGAHAPGTGDPTAAAFGLKGRDLGSLLRPVDGRGTPLTGDRARGFEIPEEAPGRSITLRYRAVEVEVPLSWYNAWLMEWSSLEGTEEGGTLVSSVAEALAALWPEYTAALAAQSGMDDDTLDSVLGCYSLHSTADRALFWRAGWGPARQVYRLMARLACVYSDDIRDDWMAPVEVPLPSGEDLEFDWCEGIGDFVRNVLKGRKAASRDGRREDCRLTVNFDEQDIRFALDYATDRCPSESGRGSGRACGRYFNPSGDDCHDSVYDGELDSWEDDGWDEDYRAWTRMDGEAPGLWYDDLDCDLMGIGAGHDLTMHPIHLQWCGFVVDRVLHLARIAYDYSRYLTGPGRAAGGLAADVARRQARWLARYAWGPVLNLGRAMVHEIGHSYMKKGGHCEYHCCFDAAALAWMWRLHGRLGVPSGQWSSGLIKGSNRESELAADFSSSRINVSGVKSGGSCRNWLDPLTDGVAYGGLSGLYDYSVQFTPGAPGRPVNLCFSNGRIQFDATGLVLGRWPTEECGRVLE